MATLTARLAQLERQHPPEGTILPASPLALAAAVGLTLDPWQGAAVASTAPRALWNCSRQSGKSTVAALLALFTALAEPGSLVLLVAPAERQAAELLRTVQDQYRALGHVVPTESETVLRLELQGGSRVIALPGKEQSIRGYSAVRLLIIDEAARVPDDLYFAVRPMLAVSGGRVIALSTPFGKRGWWYEAWEAAHQPWERVEVRADQCPRIAPAFLAEERQALGSAMYAQEYECVFLSAAAAAFDWESVERAVSVDVAPLWGPSAAAPTAPAPGHAPLWLPVD
jgi:hypothetical protein